MLNIDRKPGQHIVIDNRIKVYVSGVETHPITGEPVARIGIEAQNEVKIAMPDKPRIGEADGKRSE